MVSVAAGISSAGSVVLKESYNCLKPHYDYVKDLDKNYDKLNDESNDLSAKKIDMEEHIGRSEIAMERTHQCRNLYRKVRRVEAKVQNLETEYRKGHKYLCGMCPFIKLRKLGKRIVETTEDVVRVKNDMAELKQHTEVMTERRPEPVATDIVELNSLRQNVQELLKLLGDTKLKRIGIWGMKGVGKTTLMKKLYVEANKNGRFGVVILVSFQGKDSVTNIQDELVRELKLNANGGRETQVADTISRKLENMKYLVLIDEVFSAINLDDVGLSGSHKYGKVVFASRLKIVCREMLTNADIQVENLPLEEAQALFQSIVGDVMNRESIKVIAELIVKELGGLPQLIKAMALNLKDEDYESVWRSTLWTLQSPTESAPPHLQEVFNFFELVYGQLHVDMRRCLLYAALFPRGHEICDDYLVDCWRIEGLIRDVRQGNGGPFSMARDRGHHILKHLTERLLLERYTRLNRGCRIKSCGMVNYIKMPEQLRILALNELYPKEEGCQLLVEDGKQMDEHPAKEKWKNSVRISLMCNRLQSLPKSPKCHKVSTLLIQRNDQLQSIPKSFFAHMHKLQFLDLYKTGIESLPETLFSLINLKGLYLNECQGLVVLSSKIAKLQKLEVLDIRGTRLRSLPVEIGQLRNLKCLRILFRYNAADNLNTPRFNTLQFWKRERERLIISRNVVKKLGKLEELTIVVDPREQSWHGIVKDIAKEVASLKILSTLQFYFPDVDSLATFIRSWSGKTLTSFKVLVGYHGVDHEYGLNRSVCSEERLLRYCAGEEGIIPHEIGEVLKQATTFELIGHRNAQSLSSFGMANMKSLEVCVIEECHQMGSIVDGTVFPLLKKLHIANLQQLNCIWRGPVMPGSLGNLRTLTLNGCPMLTKILARGITQQLQQLQCLTIENCSQIKEIIEVENHSHSTKIGDAENHSITEIVEADNLSGYFPKLEILELVDLQSLVSICQADTLSWLSLEKIVIKGCPKLSNLSLSSTNARELSSILCNRHWWEDLQQSLPNGLRQRLGCLHCFIDEEQPSVNGTSSRVHP
ncbi:disease resistance protein RPS2-like [Actinidia eriantha]|uniref:disease resistance protein RPS2-like n=1 Tax=Actinidia eriantha TaxID=165200 RepID=UPI002583B930|nr:disease resistance protein RPS2-like [Actinidia eriantha]XP_057497686.1 disease resistance protein RPS2-like [Actinidia eriantha]